MYTPRHVDAIYIWRNNGRIEFVRNDDEENVFRYKFTDKPILFDRMYFFFYYLP